MAVTAGTGGSGSVDTTGDYIFQAATPDDGVAAIHVFNLDSTNKLQLLVTGMHDAGAEFSLPPGKETVLRREFNGIMSVFAKAAASTVNVDWGVCTVLSS